MEPITRDRSPLAPYCQATSEEALSKIYAKGTTGPSKGIDHVEALWDYGKDLIVSIEGGWCFQNAWPFEMAVLARCEKATIRWFMTEGNDIKVITPAGFFGSGHEADVLGCKAGQSRLE